MERIEAEPEGKYLLSTSDKSLSAEDIALGYKQIMELERAFRTLKSALSSRPDRTKDDRIHSHVKLCWLGFPIRISTAAEDEVKHSHHRFKFF